MLYLNISFPFLFSQDLQTSVEELQDGLSQEVDELPTAVDDNMLSNDAGRSETQDNCLVGSHADSFVKIDSKRDNLATGKEPPVACADYQFNESNRPSQVELIVSVNGENVCVQGLLTSDGIIEHPFEGRDERSGVVVSFEEDIGKFDQPIANEDKIGVNAKMSEESDDSYYEPSSSEDDFSESEYSDARSSETEDEVVGNKRKQNNDEGLSQRKSKRRLKQLGLCLHLAHLKQVKEYGTKDTSVSIVKDPSKRLVNIGMTCTQKNQK